MLISSENQKLILREVYKNRFGLDCLALENCRLDFKNEYLFKGFTKTGNVKLVEIFGQDASGRLINSKNRIGKIEQKEQYIRIWTDGRRYSLRIKTGDVL